MDNLLHPPEVRRRNQYSRWLLYDALKCVLRGKMSCHQAAIRYKVPRSTIQRKIHMCREQHRLALELKLQHEIQPSSYVEDIVECPISPETIAGVSPAASNSAELTSLYDCCADEMCSNGVKEEQIPQRFSASNSSNDNDNLVEVCDDEIMIRSVLMANEGMSPSTVQMKEDLNAGDLSNCDYLPVEHSISAINRRISVNLESDHDYQPTQSLDQFTEDQIDFCGEEHVIGSFEGHDELRSSSNSNDSMYCSTTNTICDLEDSYSRGCTQDALIPQQTDNCYQLPSTSIAFDSTDICNNDNNSSEYTGVDHCKLDNGGNRSVMFYDSDEFGCAQDNNSIITSASVLPMNDIYAGSSLSTLSSSSNADGYHSVAFESAHDDVNDDSSDQAYCTSSGVMFLDTTETGDCTNELMQTAADNRQFFHADGDEFYGGDELVVSDVNGERGFCSQHSDGNDLGGSESFSRDSIVEKLAVDGGLDERISFTDRDEAPPKQRRRRHFIVTKRAFRHGATFSGLRQKVDAEEEELERAADRLSEAFRSVPSRSRLPKYLNRPQEHQAYAAFHNHGSPFAVKSLSQPRVLVPAKCVLVRRHHQPMNDLYLNSVDDGSAVLRTNGVYSASL